MATKEFYGAFIGKVKKVGEKIAAVVRTNEPASYGPTSLRDPKLRTSDTWDTKKAAQLAEIETARVRNAWVSRAIAYYDEFPLGTGIELQSNDDSVLTVGKTIWEVNNFDELQHQLAIELHATGNVFAHIPPLEKANEDVVDGKTFVVPAVVLYPTAQIELIAMKDGKPSYYRRVWTEVIDPDPTDGKPKEGSISATRPTKPMYQDIPADEIVHIRINASVGEVRGTSTLQSGYHWAQQYSRILDISWSTALARSLYNIWIKIKGASKEKIDAFIKMMSENLVTKTDADGNVYEVMPSGQAMVTGDNIEVTTVSSDLKAGKDNEETRRVLLAFAVSQGIPEVLLSDGSYANLASSVTQANPFFRIMLKRQAVIIKGIQLIFRKAFDQIIKAGGFTEPALEPSQTHVVDKLNFTAPEILSRDIASVGPAVVPLVDKKIISRQEAASRVNVRWDKMKEQINQEAEEGFISAPKPPADGPGQVFPFMRLILAADPATDPAGNPRHAETFKAMKRIRGSMRTTADQYKADLLAAGMNPEEQKAALQKYIENTVELMASLEEKAEKMGRTAANE